MKIISKVITILIVITFLFSCNNKVEIWQSASLIIESRDQRFVENYENKTQYLHLLANGDAKLINRSNESKVTESQHVWKIIEKDNKLFFSLQPQKKSIGKKGIIYPIIKKNDNIFEMKYEADYQENNREVHIWQLIRIN